MTAAVATPPSEAEVGGGGEKGSGGELGRETYTLVTLTCSVGVSTTGIPRTSDAADELPRFACSSIAILCAVSVAVAFIESDTLKENWNRTLAAATSNDIRSTATLTLAAN